MLRFPVALILAVEIAALAVLGFVVPDAPIVLLSLVVPLTLVVVLVVRRVLASPALGARRLSPQAITGYRARRQESVSPEELSHSIVERATEIQRTLTESPSEIRIEMCALGYRACVNDMITLTNLINEKLPDSSFFERMKLRRARKKATDALTGAREALPPGALSATRQEQQ